MTKKERGKIIKSILSAGRSVHRCSLTFLFLLSLGLYAQIDRDSSNIDVYRFAEFLYDQGDYERAAGEYLRFAYLKNRSLNDSILFKVANCYANIGNWEKAQGYYQTLIDDARADLYKEKSEFNLALSFYKQDNHTHSIKYIDDRVGDISTNEIRNEFYNLKSLSLLHLAQWEKSLKVLDKINTNNPDVLMKSRRIARTATEGQQLRYKSPALAGIMSSVVPGSGKMYTKRYQDGVYSLVLIGLMAWQTYDGFDKKGVRSVKGWLYGGAGLIFYSGNIYGSVVSARLYNRKLNEETIQNIGVLYKF